MVAVQLQTAVTIDLAQPGIPVSPTRYGLMTEEINFSYDGGLYTELVRNRAFKDDDKAPVHWSVVQDAGGSAAIALDQRFPVAATALTTSLRLDATRAAQGHRVGIANAGYWGIPVKPNTRYRASFYARTAGAGGVPLTVSIEGTDGKTVYAQAEGGRIDGAWRRYSVTLSTGAKVKPSAGARLVIATESPGTVWFNQVSLNKEDTNTIAEPAKVVAVTSKASGLGKQFSYSFAPYSVTVLVLSVK